MDYIAIGIGSNDPDDSVCHILEYINSIAIDLGYSTIINNPNTDKEVLEGLNIFLKQEDINKLCFLYKKSKNKNISSNDISQEIHKNIIDKKYSKFELLIEKIFCKKIKFPIYFIFAYEWRIETLIKFKIGSHRELINHINHNYGWFTQLYDIKSKSFSPDLDTPFVFLIKE